MNGILQELGARGATPIVEMPVRQAIVLFGNSVTLGLILMLLTWWVNAHLDATRPESPASGAKPRSEDLDGVMSASNVLFMCLGMTAVMILVNNNLARAFAIGAAIALVRFRIKMEGKFLGTSLFYGVLVGMACGVDRVDVAWGVSGLFAALLLLVLALRSLSQRRALRAGKRAAGSKASLHPARQVSSS